MTIFSLICKFLGVYFRLYLSSRMGSEGIGLYQLIMSVYTMFSTFATAGFTIAVSRLVAENIGRNPSDAKRIYNSSLVLSFIISITATAAMFIFADKIAVIFLKDIRTAQPLKILALSMPFMAFAACMKGYFIAKRQIIKTSSASLSEQIVKIVIIMLFLNVYMSYTNDIGTLCVGIVLGITLGEIFSFVYLQLLYIYFSGRVKKKDYLPSISNKSAFKTIYKVTLPMSASVYVTSILHTAENIIIPQMFEKFSGDRSYALSQFGMIRGMVIPILFFPFAFLGSLVSILIPEISRLNTGLDKSERNNKISKIMALTFIFSTAIGGIFYFLAGEIGETFYKNENTYAAIKILALVTPFMYIETITDGLLKGIGEQVSTMRYSIYNSILRISVILALIPKAGATGYLWLLAVSNTFAFLLCIFRLKKVTGFKFDFLNSALLPLLFAILSGIISKTVADVINVQEYWIKAFAGTAVFITVFGILYLFSTYKSTKRRLGMYI